MTRIEVKKWLKQGDIKAACESAGVHREIGRRWLNGGVNESVVGGYLEEIAKARRAKAIQLAKDQI